MKSSFFLSTLSLLATVSSKRTLRQTLFDNHQEEELQLLTNDAILLTNTKNSPSGLVIDNFHTKNKETTENIVPIDSIPISYQKEFLLNEREIVQRARRQNIKEKCFVDHVLTEEICCYPIEQSGQKDCWGNGYDFQLCCGHLTMRRPHVEYLYENIDDFGGEGNQMDLLIELISANEVFSKNFDTFVDVGAGAYQQYVTQMKTIDIHPYRFVTWRTHQGGHVAFDFYNKFTNNERKVYAFEPLQRAYENLILKRTNLSISENNMKIYNLGISDFTGQIEFYGDNNTMTANKRIANHEKYGGVVSGVGNVTSIDDLLGRGENVDRINILKIDTEGLEYEVLKGSESFLSRKAIDLIIAEYGDRWSLSSFCGSRPDSDINCFPADSVDEMIGPTLKSVTKWLHEFGYASYLLGASPSSEKIVLIPLTGFWWDDGLEIARNSLLVGSETMEIQMDFVSVVEGSDIQKYIFT